jgi:ELWxxDGT repeat protein
MKSTLLPALLLAATLANATGGFSLIEMNPLHGTEEYTWSDSSKHIYGAGELSNFTELNGQLYYLGQDTTGNEELWTTDGTAQGTKMVKDINPDGPSQMGNIMTIGNKMIFVAADNNNWDFDLFASDGTEGGTVKIADISQSWNDVLSTQRAAVFGNKVLFCTSTELISTDGTSAGTKTILALSQYNPAQGYCELNGNAYFILTDNMGKPKLWMTDGTTSGTRMAFDLAGSPQDILSVEKLIAFNGKLYMVASSTNQGSDLFSFDGTELKRIVLATGGNSYPTSLNVVNNQVVFIASNMAHSNIYSMSVSDIEPQVVPSAANMDVYGSLSFCNNKIYFLGNDNHRFYSINQSTLALDSINLGAYTMPNYWFLENGSFLTGTGGKVFFAAYDTLTGNQVFMESDGTDAGTISVMPTNANTTHPFNIIIGCGSADVFDFKMWGNKVIVPANFTNAGRELWFYEPQGLVSGVQSVAKQELQVQLFPNPTSKELFVRLPNNVYCDNTQLKVTALNGQLMLQDSFAGNTGSLDVSGLAAGNYCLTITGPNHSAINRHFVVGK